MTGNNLLRGQMSYNLKTSREREVKGLVEAMEKFNVKKGLIITQDYEAKETIEGNGC